jgi:glucosyl-3-phosphoglycerate phosphatase
VTTIILWRHGNTDWNNQRRFQGQTDVPLNERGLAQTIAAAGKLALLKADLLITSDLSRCAQTAAALVEVSGLAVERDARLRERCFGDWEGLTRDEVIQQHPEAWGRWRSGDEQPGCGIEPVADVGKRMAEFIRQTAERVPGKTAVLVSHGASIKWGIGALLGWPEESVETLRGMSNCHWAQLYHDAERGWVLVGYNLGA